MPRPSHDSSRRDVFRWLAAVGVGLVAGTTAHGVLYERHHVGVTRARMPVPGLAPALDGLRVGLLTDTHHSAFTSAGFIARASQLLNDAAPDLIVLGGDYVTLRDRRFAEPSAAAMATLTAPHGVFAVLGNHDDEIHVPQALQRRGVTLLRDERTSLRVRGERLDLIGLRFWTRDVDTLARLARGMSRSTILLAHDPRRLAEAERVGVSAVLAGHTHGGQIAPPLVGPIAARKYPIAEGLLTRPTTSLFVSRGLGTVVVPCRVNCPPEVAVITLQATARPRLRPT